jgi:hypothetical protein
MRSSVVRRREGWICHSAICITLSIARATCSCLSQFYDALKLHLLCFRGAFGVSRQTVVLSISRTTTERTKFASSEVMSL